MFDLPDPLGPTTTQTPGSKSSVVLSAKDLNPFSVSDRRNTRPPPPDVDRRGVRRRQRGLPTRGPEPVSPVCGADHRIREESASPTVEPIRSTSTPSTLARVGPGPAPGNRSFDGAAPAPSNSASTQPVGPVAHISVHPGGLGHVLAGIPEQHALYPPGARHGGAHGRHRGRHTWHASQKNVDRFE